MRAHGVRSGNAALGPEPLAPTSNVPMAGKGDYRYYSRYHGNPDLEPQAA